MRIERITDLVEVLKCLPFEREVRKKGRDRTKESDMLLILKTQLPNPNFGFWIAYGDDEEVLGYTVASLTLFYGMRAQNILRMYAKDPELNKELWKILNGWAKENRIKVQRTTVYKNFKAVQRKYGFRPVSVNMERPFDRRA